MADHDDDYGTDGTDDVTQQDSNLVKDLRRQLRQAQKELGELRPLRTESTLRDLGIDPKSKQARLLLKVHGDGEQTAEALRATAEEFDIALPDPTANTDAEAAVYPATQQRQEATERIDDLRANATPVGTQRIGWNDYQALMGTNPDAAAQALQSGQVDLPPHVEAVLNANRADPASSLTGA